MSAPLFSIVVPTFQRPAILRETLTAIFALDPESPPYEVVVIDDGEDETTADVAREFAGRDIPFTFAAQSRLGVATARNHGARLARGELLMFCDDDTIVAPSVLRQHLTIRQHHHDPIVKGVWEFPPQMLTILRTTPFGRFRIARDGRVSPGELCDDGCLKVRSIAANSFALRRQLFWELGGFDESFPCAGAEDQEFSLRARMAGCLLLVAPQIRLLHNDWRLDLRAYCAREEQKAQTMPFLARKHPDEFNHLRYVSENRPIEQGDSIQLIIKKLAKTSLATRPVLATLRPLTRLFEAAHLPDRALYKLYRLQLGLYLFRGFRSTWT